jgi:hypothetical protein
LKAAVDHWASASSAERTAAFHVADGMRSLAKGLSALFHLNNRRHTARLRTRHLRRPWLPHPGITRFAGRSRVPRRGRPHGHIGILPRGRHLRAHRQFVLDRVSDRRRPADVAIQAGDHAEHPVTLTSASQASGSKVPRAARRSQHTPTLDRPLVTGTGVAGFPSADGGRADPRSGGAVCEPATSGL